MLDGIHRSQMLRFLLWQYGVWMSFWHFQNFGIPESG